MLLVSVKNRPMFLESADGFYLIPFINIGLIKALLKSSIFIAWITD